MEVDKERMDSLLKKIKPKGCPLCEHNEWLVGENVFCTIEYYTDGNVFKDGKAFPIVPLTCSYCGNTYFINAYIGNIIDHNKDNKETKSNEQ